MISGLSHHRTIHLPEVGFPSSLACPSQNVALFSVVAAAVVAFVLYESADTV